MRPPTQRLLRRLGYLAVAKSQVRTLFAAERSMQATVTYLSGVVLGASLYGLLEFLDVRFDAQQPTAEGFWLLVFVAPYALMQAGFLLFIGGVWVIVPQFLRPVRPIEVWRRVAREP